MPVRLKMSTAAIVKRDDRQHANLQFRPRKRPCSWHVSHPTKETSRMYGSVERRSASASPSNTMKPSRSMMNSASRSFSGVAGIDLHLAVRVAHRHVRGDVEGIPQLMGHHDRADALEVAQLDDLVVDRNGRDRIEPCRRLVVQQDAAA